MPDPVVPGFTMPPGTQPTTPSAGPSTRAGEQLRPIDAQLASLSYQVERVADDNAKAQRLMTVSCLLSLVAVGALIGVARSLPNAVAGG